MTDAQKTALMKKLGAESNRAFDSRYSGDNRKWFAGKIIDALLSQGVPDADIEKKTNDIIIAAGKALNARIKKGFSPGSLANLWRLYDQLRSRTQIIYGMIAMHPQFLDPANADLFDFVLERRFRSIQRMTFYVNPNDVRNVFAYPDPDATPPQQMKVNKNAASFWSGFQGGTLPFVLTASGKSDPETAVEKLFVKNKGSDRNLFACDPVASILHMDSLRVAKNPGKLLNTLVGLGDHYLKIDNPLGHFGNNPAGQRLVGVTSAPVSAGSNVEIALGKVGPILGFIEGNLTAASLKTNAFIPFKGPRFIIVLGDVFESFVISEVNPVTGKIKVGSLTKSYTAAGARVYARRGDSPLYSTLPFHFITDSRPSQALFEQLTIKSADLQVGDHVYVTNHPLYKIYYPSGAWGGEHSFISEIGSRDSTGTVFRNNLKVTGHGLNNTLLGMVDEMLEWNNIVLSILQTLTRMHLDYLKANGRKGTGKVKFITRKEGGVDVNVFEYGLPYTYSVVTGGKKKSVRKTRGFVIKEQAGNPDSAFQVFNPDGTDSIVDATHPPPEVFLGVVFVGAGPGEQFLLSKWAVPFFNTQTPSFDTHPLFEKDNKTPKMLTFEDVGKSKPFLVTDDLGDAFVIRPRVDFSTAYQTFLRNNGAI